MKKLRQFLFATLLCLLPMAVMSAPPVNINTADSETLVDALVGIGPQKAMAIVRHRQKNGPFKRVDDLTRVSGIGQKTVDINRSRMTVAPAKTANAK